MDNCAESGLSPDGTGYIIINALWFVDRIIPHQDDVEFYIFHELRHIHQNYQVWLMNCGQETRESMETVKQWDAGFKNYKRNEGGDTQRANVTQEVEVDANAYGIILEILYRKGRQPLLSLPMEAREPAEERLQHYVDTLPEFSAYSPKSKTSPDVKTEKQMPIVKGRKVGRNELCPCGSGVKFKYCCIGKGIYD